MDEASDEPGCVNLGVGDESIQFVQLSLRHPDTQDEVPDPLGVTVQLKSPALHAASSQSVGCPLSSATSAHRSTAWAVSIM